MPDVRLASPQGKWILLTTVLGSSMALLDSTVVNVALPRIGRDLVGRHPLSEEPRRRVLGQARLGDPEQVVAHAWVPAERRFEQASVTRAAMLASASLPQVRGS